MFVFLSCTALKGPCVKGAGFFAATQRKRLGDCCGEMLWIHRNSVQISKILLHNPSVSLFG